MTRRKGVGGRLSVYLQKILFALVKFVVSNGHFFGVDGLVDDFELEDVEVSLKNKTERESQLVVSFGLK